MNAKQMADELERQAFELDQKAERATDERVRKHFASRAEHGRRYAAAIRRATGQKTEAV